MTIQNPVEWGYGAVRDTIHGVKTAYDWHRAKESLSDPAPRMQHHLDRKALQ
jgi:hypothetical protein